MMTPHEFADRVADRSFTGYAASGPGLREKIRNVTLDVLAGYEPEARKLERRLAIVEAANKGTCAQFRITINSLKVSKARADRQAADNAVSYHDLRLAISLWENRSGLDHNELLKEGS